MTVRSMLVATGLSLALYLSGFFILFTPLPLVFVAMKHGRLAQTGAFLGGLVLLFILYSFPSSPWPFFPFASFYPHWDSLRVTGLGVLYFFYYGWMATVIFLCPPHLSLERGFAFILFLTLLIPFAMGGLFFEWQGIDGIAELKSLLHFWVERMIGMQEKSGFEGEQVLFLKEHGEEIISQIIGVAPALLINFCIITLSLNIFFIRRWMLQAKILAGWADFSLWRLDERSIFIPIGLGGLYFLNLYALHSPWLSVFAVNALFVLVFVYFFQGLAVTIFLFKRKLTPFGRIMAYLTIFLFLQVVGVLLILMGIFDFWFDFRKVKKLTSQP